MKIARIRTDDGIRKGEYQHEDTDDGIHQSQSEYRRENTDGVSYGGTVTTDDGDTYRVGEDADLLAPCEPGSFYCVGRNFAETIDQMDYDVPDQPDWFIKPAVSLHHPGDPIVHPPWTDELTYAGELAAVVGETCTDLDDEDDVREALRGWTILNDLDALDQPGRTARKAFDGSAPLGPVLATDFDPRNVAMETYVADELRQDATTDLMLFDPYEVVAFLSERYTFRPGDVISFGSPANPGLLEPGDVVAIRYEGIGWLRNPVVAPDGG